MFGMRRRVFITLLGGAAVAWPLAARAQQPPMPVIGFLRPSSAESVAHLLVAFRAGLKEAGFVEGQNVTIDYRWAEGQDNRLPEIAADLVRRQVAAIVTPGTADAAFAAKAATKTIPIVFSTGIDPVKLGLVASINRPGGNLTGIYQWAGDLGAKRLGILHELVQGVPEIAVIVNPAHLIEAESIMREVEVAAGTLGLKIKALAASNSGDIDAAFANIARQRIGAVLVSPDSYFTSRRVQFATLANRYVVPAMFSIREYVEVGGLMSYGRNISNEWHSLGLYVGRILKGEKELPVEQASKFEFVVNLVTAKALGLEIPPTLLARADEVIE
jgi:putative tryptophan/tyrosine transport system substrate-binding protein